MIEIGCIREITRYPVKSMAGIAVESAQVGWHGLAGDRRFAFRRMNAEDAFPWLSASRLPEMLSYTPVGLDESSGEPLSTHVLAPDGARLELGSAELNNALSDRFGSRLELMRLKHGIFDEAAVSVLNLATIAGIGREAGLTLDRRRFRANILLESEQAQPFAEDGWVGGRLLIGEGESRVVLSVTQGTLRCTMINLDPDTGEKDARVMRAAVRLNRNVAGVYATVVRAGTIRVGDAVRFQAESPDFG